MHRLWSRSPHTTEPRAPTGLALQWPSHSAHRSFEKYAQKKGQFVRRGSRLWMGEGGGVDLLIFWRFLHAHGLHLHDLGALCRKPSQKGSKGTTRTYFLCIGKLWKIAARVKLSLVRERQSSMAGSTQSWDSQAAALAISISLGGISRTLWQLEVLEWHRQIMPNKRTASSKIDMTTINHKRATNIFVVCKVF